MGVKPSYCSYPPETGNHFLHSVEARRGIPSRIASEVYTIRYPPVERE